MSGPAAPLTGPDLALGIRLSEIPDGGILPGHAFDEAVIVCRVGAEVYAVGANCSHYGGPLDQGIVANGSIRCPWHHARFDLSTGEAVSAPALNPIACWQVERKGDRVRILAKRQPDRKPRTAAGGSLVIVGAGAAGNAAAEMLRREGFGGKVTLIGKEDSVPYDRPNLSKDYLAGNAPEEWIPLRSKEFYQEQQVDLILGTEATVLDAAGMRVVLADGRSVPFDACLLATGADPVRLPTPGSTLPHVCYLRSLAESRAIVARCKEAKRAVVIGASFIGLEVAASLRARNIEVDVVAPEARPLERIMGPQLGDFIRGLHEAHGVRFHLGQTADAIRADSVTLHDGRSLAADLVIIGVGVRPAVGLAERARLSMDRGVLVNEYLETSARGVYAAGDIARWPDPRSGRSIRVEHWVVAERQGQVAALNMLGRRRRFDAVPFFWSQHYDVMLSYTGHAETWDRIAIAGSLPERDACVAFFEGNRVTAAITVGRDRVSLTVEAALERNDWEAVARAVRG